MDRRLRIVYVDHVARLSGGEIALLRLLPALSEHVDAHVVLGEDGPLVDGLRDIGVDTEVLPLPVRVRDTRRADVRATRLDPVVVALLPLYVYRLARRLRELRPDLVHTNSLKAALYGGLAARLAGLPVVWHVRDRIAPDVLTGGAVALVRAALRVLPAAVVAESHATLEALPPSGGAVRAVVPNTVEPPVTSEARSGSAAAVGVVGRLAPWKGQHVFLDAFATAFRGTGVRGRVIGAALFGEDAYSESLRQRANELGVSAQIEFRGFREDVWSELCDLEILVHSSISPEPFGQVVLEGMAAGLPVVAAAGGGPDELIRNGIDGLLTTPGDADELATALRRLHEDPELRARLGAAARERSRAFTPERAAREMHAVYRAVLRR